MVHIEKSAFRAREYTALAGTAETLDRYSVKKDLISQPGYCGYGWRARGRDHGQVYVARTLADLDAIFVRLSKKAEAI